MQRNVSRAKCLVKAPFRSQPVSSRRIQLEARSTGNKPPAFAFVFDIDGVLLQGERVLPPAKRALALLEGQNSLGIKIPYIFLTNGGGVTESDRCKKLTKQLGVQINPRQYIQGHTIFTTLSPKYSDEAVLVLGGKLDAVRKVAEGYGYRNAYTTTDVLAWNPSVWPYHEASPAELEVAKVNVSLAYLDTRTRDLKVFNGRGLTSLRRGCLPFSYSTTPETGLWMSRYSVILFNRTASLEVHTFLPRNGCRSQ